MKKKRLNRIVYLDIKYNNYEISKFINVIMVSGKKTLARKIIYNSFEYIRVKFKKSPLKVFFLALDNVAPMIEIKTKRVMNNVQSIPSEIKTFRRISLAMKWIKESSKSRSEKQMHVRLAHEFLDASEKKGISIKKRENIHKIIYVNKSYSRYYN